MRSHYKFNRLEFAGSLGDLGTLLPLAIGLILINDLAPSGIFLSVGLFYLLSGAYFGVTVPVQPMKIISAYAIATGMSASQIFASGALMSVLLIVLSLVGIVSFISRHIPLSVVRGVQFSTGILLMIQGVRLIMGTSKFQVQYNAVEPFLSIQAIGPVPIGILIGIAGAVITFLLIDNKKLPAGLIVVLMGLVLGIFLGTKEVIHTWRFGVYLPQLFPVGMPSAADFSFAAIVLVLPQLPMTIGNAAIAYADLSKEYFGKAADRITPKSACLSMGLANALSFALGGMPLCHGAGGLAAHYRFGARGPGSNMMIGIIFVALAIFLGPHVLHAIMLIPLSIMGVLLVFAGCQLSLTILDIKQRKDMFVVLTILGITLAANLAAGFIIGTAIAYGLKFDRLSV
jgi:sulfate permease, SulP family